MEQNQKIYPFSLSIVAFRKTGDDQRTDRSRASNVPCTWHRPRAYGYFADERSGSAVIGRDLAKPSHPPLFRTELLAHILVPLWNRCAGSHCIFEEAVGLCYVGLCRVVSHPTHAGYLDTVSQETPPFN